MGATRGIEDVQVAAGLVPLRLGVDQRLLGADIEVRGLLRGGVVAGAADAPAALIGDCFQAERLAPVGLDAQDSRVARARDAGGVDRVRGRGAVVVAAV